MQVLVVNNCLLIHEDRIALDRKCAKFEYETNRFLEEIGWLASMAKKRISNNVQFLNYVKLLSIKLLASCYEQ
jgi:hypothetical protein